MHVDAEGSRIKAENVAANIMKAIDKHRHYAVNLVNLDTHYSLLLDFDDFSYYSII